MLSNRIVQSVERRLCRGREHNARAVLGAQMRERRQRRYGEVLREALRLVEHDDRVLEIVQLAACRRTIGEQRLQQLDIGRQDDGGVPVFGQQAALALLVIGSRPFGVRLGFLGAKPGEVWCSSTKCPSRPTNTER